jgi:hypothetical protein
LEASSETHAAASRDHDEHLCALLVRLKRRGRCCHTCAIVASITRLIERLIRPPEEVRSENLRLWASTIAGAAPISQVEARTRCKVAGVVQNIRIDPREGTGSIEATIIDGSGRMIAKWLGRRSLAGVTLGMGIVVEGTAGKGEDDELVILNPDYRLVPDPEHG